MKRVMSIFVAGGLLFYSAAPVFAEEDENSEALVDCGELESSLEVEALDEVNTVEDLAEHDQTVEVECDSGERVSSDKEEVVHNEELETAETVCSKVDMGEEVSIEEDAEDDSWLDAELNSSELVESESEHVELADEEESLALPQDDSTEQHVCIEAETADENTNNSTKEDAVLESEDIDDLAPSKQTEAVVEAPDEKDNGKTVEEYEQTEASDVEELADLEEERGAEEQVSEVASADPTIGDVSTASVGNSPIIQTDIEIETIAPSGTSINPGSNSNSNNSSGNGNSSNSNGTSNNSAGSNSSTGMNNSVGSNNSSGTNNSNSRPTVNQQSGSQSNQGGSSNRLPQTGGVMDQTRVILLSGLMILVGAVLRITSSRKRKFD